MTNSNSQAGEKEAATNGNGKTHSEQVKSPTLPLMIHAQYVRDMSFENPNAPGMIWNKSTSPEMDIDIGMSVRRLPSEEIKDFFEMSLTLTATAKRGEKTVYIAEIIYAAAVSLKDVPEEKHHPMLLIEVPRQIFPYARQLMGEMTQNGGYPPLWLNPVDFHAMYVHRFAKEAGEEEAGKEDSKAMVKETGDSQKTPQKESQKESQGESIGNEAEKARA